jgi:hypothetical protein
MRASLLPALESNPDVAYVTLDHPLKGADDYTDAAANVSAACGLRLRSPHGNSEQRKPHGCAELRGLGNFGGVGNLRGMGHECEWQLGSVGRFIATS